MPSNTFIGHNHAENQVSTTSESCLRSVAKSDELPVFSFANANASIGFSATTKSSFPSP